ncbi:hypothetical protein BDV96DRAFT_403048 [Lophiotrema nucula]|uniref:BTB domain-containing protein n=1 Tax=Lophiotrema nucula TaxID=690887 RepID=A0A6A5ZE37_9PLEO|nr:hypothetical protein BDV96DRAFT_403048 [Lophiotrema nucula]
MISTASICAPASGPASSSSNKTIGIPIARGGDFLVRIAPPVRPLAPSAAQNGPRSRPVLELRVSKNVLASNSAYFQGILGLQPGLSMVTIDDNGSNRHALELWLRAAHQAEVPKMLKAVHSRHVWNTVAVGKLYGFLPLEAPAVKAWFIDYYKETLQNGAYLTPGVARTLAYPCAYFDHAEGFMKLTKFLVFNMNDKLYSLNTSDYEALNNEARLLDAPLLSARLDVQDRLARELDHPLRKLHQATCACRKETAFDYEDALAAIGCWPIASAFTRYTLSQILEKLGTFNFTPDRKDCESGYCRLDFNKSVRIAITRTKEEFDGLCLDCMKRSKAPQAGQARKEYIEKNSPFKGCWDMDCRYGHAQTTWRHSWTGSPTDRRLILGADRGERVRHRELERERAREKEATAGREWAPRGRRSGRRRSHFSMGNGNGEAAALDGAEHEDIDDDDEFYDAEEDTYLTEDIAELNVRDE